jgi:hypothetical protein
MSNVLKGLPAYEDHRVRQQRLAFSFGVTANATPANKTYSNDLPGVCYIRTQGITAAADAVETVTWTAAADTTNSVFGFLIDVGPKCEKVYGVTITSVAGKTLAVTGPNNVAGVAAMVTTNGRIAIEIVATALNFASVSDTFLVQIDYREKR